MARRYYYKLIRDNVPAIMDTKAVSYEVLTLDDAAYADALLRKVSEEAAEVASAQSRADVVREMGDLCDVLDAARVVYGITDEELLAARAGEWEKKGGFDKRLFLLWSEDRS